MIFLVAASERETAQTEYVSSSEALRIRGRGNRLDGTPKSSGSYKSDEYLNGLERPTIGGDSPVRKIHSDFLDRSPKYHGTRETLWEFMRTIS